MMNRSDEDLKVIHNDELKITEFFIKICEEYNLEYTMLGGTMLGAIRHKGFIPWDDDMDFGMPRKDYEKLITLLSHEQPSKFQFKNFKLDTSEIYFSRLEYAGHTVIDTSATISTERHPWIDIFPLDYIDNTKEWKFSLLKLRLLYRRLMLQYSSFDTIVNQDLPGRKGIEKVLINIGKIIHPEKYLDTHNQLVKMDKLLNKINNKGGKSIINFMGIYKFNELFDSEIYLNTELYSFEHLKLKGPKSYDTYLKQLYGEYMIPTPEKDRNKHHIYLKQGD